ncbi:MAG: hypothetical protein EU535_08440 [Promethearchaeota archaeon]|nr:MAG: hypothetical protein EU535_08440 [Candidatus Lokiarchaeota archaeon]
MALLLHTYWIKKKFKSATMSDLDQAVEFLKNGIEQGHENGKVFSSKEIKKAQNALRILSKQRETQKQKHTNLIQKIKNGEMGYFVWGTIRKFKQGILITPQHDMTTIFADGLLQEDIDYKIIFRFAKSECPYYEMKSKEAGI